MLSGVGHGRNICIARRTRNQPRHLWVKTLYINRYITPLRAMSAFLLHRSRIDDTKDIPLEI